MTKHIKTLILTILLIFPFYSEAQLLNRIKKAAERGVGNAVERTAQKEAEKLAMRQMEKMLQNLYGDDYEEYSGMDFSKIMSGISTNVETADSYDFSGHVVMEITSKDEKGKMSDPMTMKTFLSEDPTITAMEMEAENEKKGQGKMVMIYDFDRNASIILMDNDGEKTSMAYGFDFEKMSEGMKTEETEAAEEDYTFKKTGNTKTILGYSCEEYVVENDEMKMNYWFTDKPIAGVGSLWGQNNPYLKSKMKNNPQINYQNMPNGNVLEMHMDSKKDKSGADILVKEINENQGATFIMEEYPNVFKGMEK